MSNDNDKTHHAGLGITIPQSMIEDTIRAEMISAMPNKEEWVAAIVKRAMDTPAKDSHGYADRNKTLFQKACEDMIISEAKAVFAEWLKQHRDDIRKALISSMNRSKGKRIKDLAEKMADGVCTGYISGVNFKLRTEEY